jgi:hypothetical protein
MTRPIVKYFEDGKIVKTRYSAINNPKKERILSRFRRRAINCKRFNVISPEFDISI